MIINLDEFLNTFDEEWTRAIVNCRNSIPEKYLADSQLIKIVSNVSTLNDLATIIKLIYLDSKESPLAVNSGTILLFQNIENSCFNLKEWLEALVYFQEWLESKNRKSSLSKMLGFLMCCEESPENKIFKTNSKTLLKNMLTEYGYIG
jgi:hypothetical protein